MAKISQFCRILYTMLFALVLAFSVNISSFGAGQISAPADDDEFIGGSASEECELYFGADDSEHCVEYCEAGTMMLSPNHSSCSVIDGTSETELLEYAVTAGYFDFLKQRPDYPHASSDLGSLYEAALVYLQRSGTNLKDILYTSDHYVASNSYICPIDEEDIYGRECKIDDTSVATSWWYFLHPYSVAISSDRPNIVFTPLSRDDGFLYRYNYNTDGAVNTNNPISFSTDLELRVAGNDLLENEFPPIALCPIGTTTSTHRYLESCTGINDGASYDITIYVGTDLFNEVGYGDGTCDRLILRQVFGKGWTAVIECGGNVLEEVILVDYSKTEGFASDSSIYNSGGGYIQYPCGLGFSEFVNDMFYATYAGQKLIDEGLATDIINNVLAREELKGLNSSVFGRSTRLTTNIFYDYTTGEMVSDEIPHHTSIINNFECPDNSCPGIEDDHSNGYNFDNCEGGNSGGGNTGGGSSSGGGGTATVLTIDWDEDGGSDVANTTCTYGNNLTLPAAPTREGYVFAGWKLTDNTIRAAGSTITGGCTSTYTGVTSGTSSNRIKAQWKIHCDAGQYLPANATECSDCTYIPTDKWCPGGDFYVQDAVQGYEQCPEIQNYGNAASLMASYGVFLGPVDYNNNNIKDTVRDCGALFTYSYDANNVGSVIDSSLQMGLLTSSPINTYDASSDYNKNIAWTMSNCLYNPNTGLYDYCMPSDIWLGVTCKNGYYIPQEKIHTDGNGLVVTFDNFDTEICVPAQSGYYTNLYDLHKNDADNSLADKVGVSTTGVSGAYRDIISKSTAELSDLYKKCPNDYPESDEGSWKIEQCYALVTFKDGNTVLKTETHDFIGSSDGSNVTSNSYYISTYRPLKDNYSFDGWYTDPHYSSEKITTSSSLTGNKTLYAKWVPTSCGDGEYMNDGGECVSCPAGYTDGTNASSIYQCYKDSAVNCEEYFPVSNAQSPYAPQSATCKIYYGSTTCVLNNKNACNISSLSCQSGYELTGRELDATNTNIQHIKYRKVYGNECVYTDGSEALSEDCTNSVFDDIAPGNWEIEYDFGTISGTSICSATVGTNFVAGNPDVTTSGDNCWCRMEKLDGEAAISQWVHVQVSQCGGNCAVACMLGSTYSEQYRNALYSNLTQTCEVKQTINCAPGWYLPANSNQCVQCTESTSFSSLSDMYWCPGGNDLYVSENDQGLEACPSINDNTGAYDYTFRGMTYGFMDPDKNDIKDKETDCFAVFIYGKHPELLDGITTQANTYNSSSELNQYTALNYIGCFYNQTTGKYDKCTIPSYMMVAACDAGYKPKQSVINAGLSLLDEDMNYVENVREILVDMLASPTNPCEIGEANHYTTTYDVIMSDVNLTEEERQIADKVGVEFVLGHFVNFSTNNFASDISEVYKECPTEYPSSEAGSWKVAQCYATVTFKDGNTVLKTETHDFSGSSDGVTVTSTPYHISNYEPTKAGYKFAGWYENADFSGNPITTSTDLTGNKTLYAKWTPTTTYHIEYKEPQIYSQVGGSGTYGMPITLNGLSPTEFTIDSEFDLPTQIPGREGYVFGGWYTTESLSGDPVTKIELGTSGDKTFYVKWTTVKCDKGYFLDAGGNVCSKCNGKELYGNTNYCSGGTFTVSDSKQGLTQCPVTDNTKEGAYYIQMETMDTNGDNLIGDKEDCIAYNWYAGSQNIMTHVFGINSSLVGYDATKPANIYNNSELAACLYNESENAYIDCLTYMPTYLTCKKGYTITQSDYDKFNNIINNVEYDVVSNYVEIARQNNDIGEPFVCSQAQPGYYTNMYDLGISNVNNVGHEEMVTETGLAFILGPTESGGGVLSPQGESVSLSYVYKQCPTEYPSSEAGSWKVAQCYATVTFKDGNTTLKTETHDFDGSSDGVTITSNPYHISNYEPTKAGYEFVGWYENADFSGNQITTSTDLTGNKTLYAKWYEECPAVDNSSFGAYGFKLTHIGGIEDVENCITEFIYTNNPENIDILWPGHYYTPSSDYNRNDVKNSSVAMMVLRCKYNRTTGLYDRCAPATVLSICKNGYYIGNPEYELSLYGSTITDIDNLDLYEHRTPCVPGQRGYYTTLYDRHKNDELSQANTIYRDNAGVSTSNVFSDDFSRMFFDIIDNDVFYDNQDFLYKKCPDAYPDSDIASWQVAQCYATVTFKDSDTTLKTETHDFDGTSDGVTVTSNPYHISNYEPNRVGYEFAGWYENADFSGNPITTSTDLTGNKTLYAHWLRQVTIHFDANADSDNTQNIPADIICTDRQDCNTMYEDSYGPARNGYAFVSWNSAADGTGTDFTYTTTPHKYNVAYFNGVLDLTDGHEITLYAQWEPETYNISYYNDNMAYAFIEPAQYTYSESSQTITPTEPTENNYVFIGWCYDDADCDNPQKTITIPGGTTGNRHYYARWEVAGFTITYELDGGVAENITSYTVETDDFVLNNPTKTGYVFQGWCEEEQHCDNPQEDYTFHTAAGGNRTLYAEFEPIQYTIEFNGTGADGYKLAVTCEYDKNCDISNNGDFVYEGYDFVGWAISQNATEPQYLQTPTGITVFNLTDTPQTFMFYAVWGPKTIDLAYVYNNNSSATYVTSCMFDGSVLPVTPPAREGFRFAGWRVNVGLDSLDQQQCTSAGFSWCVNGNGGVCQQNPCM